MHPDFLPPLFIGILATFIYSIIIARQKDSFMKPSMPMLITIGISAIVVGVGMGSISIHGFEFPFWGFSALFFIACLVFYTIGQILMLLIYTLKR